MFRLLQTGQAAFVFALQKSSEQVVGFLGLVETLVRAFMNTLGRGPEKVGVVVLDQMEICGSCTAG